jgi:hypothetical protein
MDSRPLLVLLSFSPLTLVAAQSTDLRGAVRDSANRPIADVEVSVRGNPTRTATDAAGRFMFRLPGDSAYLTLRRVGFRPLTVAVTLVGEGLPALSLVMAAEPQILPELKTTGRPSKPAKYAGTLKYDGYFRREKLGLGTFIDREKIERLNAFHTLEILRGIPGINVDVGNPGDPATADIRMARCSNGRGVGLVPVFIDGSRVLPNSNGFNPDSGMHGTGTLRLAEMLSRISAPGIELVEVYRGMSQIPAEFYEPLACGAIAIWTRYHNATKTAEVKDTAKTPRQQGGG